MKKCRIRPAWTRRLLISSLLAETSLPASLDNTKKKSTVDLRNHSPRSVLVIFFLCSPPSFFVPLFLPPHRLVMLDNHRQLPSAVEPEVGGSVAVFLTHAAELALPPQGPSQVL